MRRSWSWSRDQGPEILVLVSSFLKKGLDNNTDDDYATVLGISDEVIALLLSLSASIFTIVGGVGGGLYMAYFACVGVISVVLVYFFNAFYVAESATHAWGFAFDDRAVTDTVCDIIQCGRTGSGAGNLNDSLLTFSSLKGFLFGVCCVLSTFLCCAVPRYCRGTTVLFFYGTSTVAFTVLFSTAIPQVPRFFGTVLVRC